MTVIVEQAVGERVADAEIQFAADSAGSAPLTWGQLAIWQCLTWQGEQSGHFNLSHVFAVPPDRTEADVLAAVRLLVEVHEGLRTRFPDYATAPRQEVHARGRISVLRYQVPGTAEAGPEDDLDACTEAVLDRLRAEPFRLGSQWPLRLAMIMEGGRPARLVLILSHQIIDGISWRMLKAQMYALFAGEPVVFDRDSWNARELAAYEQSEAGIARSRASIRRWCRDLAAVPRSVVDYQASPVPPGQPRYRGLTMVSPALAAAAHLLADRLATSTSTVVLTTLAMVLARHTGHSDLAVRLISSTRLQPESKGTFAPVTEDGLVTVSLGGLDVDQAVAVCWRSALTCMRTAQYEPVALSGAIDDLQRERGAHLGRELFFNDVRGIDRWPDCPAVTTEPELADLRALTTVAETGAWDSLNLTVFLTLRAVREHAVAHLEIDTAYLPVDVGMGLLRGMEALLVRAAFHRVGPAELDELVALSPVVRDAGWVRVGRDWVRPGAVASLVTRAVGSRAAGAFVIPGTGSDAAELHCYLVPEDPECTPERAHAKVMAALLDERRTDILAPTRYVICSSAPSDASSLEHWRAQSVIAAGTGR